MNKTTNKLRVVSINKNVITNPCFILHKYSKWQLLEEGTTTSGWASLTQIKTCCNCGQSKLRTVIANPKT